MYRIPIVAVENEVGLALGLSDTGTATLLITTPKYPLPVEITLLKDDWRPLYDQLYPFVWRIISLTDEVNWDLGDHSILFRRLNMHMSEAVIDSVYHTRAFTFAVTHLCDALKDFFDFTPPPLAPLLQES